MEYKQINKTMIEMMTDRNYTVVQNQPHNPEANLQPMMKVAKGNGKILWVYIVNIPKFGKQDINNFLEMILNTSKDNTHTILITRNELTPQAKAIVVDFKKTTGHTFETFLYEETMFNKYRHTLQPKFVILTPEKVKAMCKKFQVSLADFPKLSADDTMARYFGMKPKDVTQCIRKNGVYYRVVV